MRTTPSRNAKQNGVYYTPLAVAKRLATLACSSIDRSARIGDPSCGDGRFLIATIEALVARGADPYDVVTRQIFGCDIDPVAVSHARTRIADWSLAHLGARIEPPHSHLVIADPLVDRFTNTWLSPTFSLDAVIGNPPFGAQLKSVTAASRSRRNELDRAFPGAKLGYADTAGLFLVRALEMVREGGLVMLILPDSLLAARDASPIRDFVSPRTAWQALWYGGSDVGFDASVNVWAPIFTVHSQRSKQPPILRYVGADVRPCNTVKINEMRNTWSYLISDLTGGMASGTLDSLSTSGRVVGDVVTSHAGFRRHFYGLAPHIVEKGHATSKWPRVVTTGMIDPCRLRRDGTVRIAKREFREPVLDAVGLAGSNESLALWASEMQSPKILVASQGKVLEVVVDERGVSVPSTPVIALKPRAGTPVNLSAIAAVLTSPVAAAMLHETQAGSGLSGDVCRVSGAFLASIPLPMFDQHLATATDFFNAAMAAAMTNDANEWNRALDQLGLVMLAAYGRSDATELFDWWKDRRPPWRDARR